MDELLLARAKNGDAQAFEELMTPLENRIWRICWHYTGRREEAEDCAQETMLKVWRSLGTFRGTIEFEGWVCRIAANCCLDSLRKKKKDMSVSIEPLKESGFDPADPGPGTEDTVIASDDRSRLRQAISALPDEQREALVLTQLEGVSYEDAAGLLGVSEGTVKSRVNRAKAKLKEILSGTKELSPVEYVRSKEGRLRS